MTTSIKTVLSIWADETQSYAATLGRMAASVPTPHCDTLRRVAAGMRSQAHDMRSDQAGTGLACDSCGRHGPQVVSTTFAERGQPIAVNICGPGWAAWRR